MCPLIWCLSTIFISDNRPCHQHHKKARIRPRTPPQNIDDSRAYHQPTRVLPEDHILPALRQVLWTATRSSHGVTHKAHIAKLYIEEFENRAINTAVHPPGVWKRYVDDTFVVKKTSYKDRSLKHLNSLDSHIQFNTETSRENGPIPFLDTLVMPQPDMSLITTVYRKPTHTYSYLQWDSHHNLAAKFSGINTLTLKSQTVCSSP